MPGENEALGVRRWFHRHDWEALHGYYAKQVLTHAGMTVVFWRCTQCGRTRYDQRYGFWPMDLFGLSPNGASTPSPEQPT